MLHNKKGRKFLILICLFCVSVFAQAKSSDSVVPNQQLKPGQMPGGLSASHWGSIQTQIKAGKYKTYLDDKGGFNSSNPAHGWQIHYGANGTTTLNSDKHDSVDYSLGLKLDAIGYQTLKPLDHPEKISSQDNTLDYRWNKILTERWINNEKDLEQWFFLTQRPEGATNGHPLTLQMTLDSKLKARQHGNNIRFSNPSGTTITYNKLKVWDADGHNLPAQMKLADQQLKLLVDDSTARYPLTIDPSFQQQAYLKASNTGENDDFGFSVAISGDTLVVGAPREQSNATGVNGDQSNNDENSAGAAYVFFRSGNTWSQQAYLKKDSIVGSFERFGSSVAIAGDTIVVGAESNDTDGVTDAGAAYVFTRSGTTWSQQSSLQASNSGEFGNSVDIAGDTLIVGAFSEGGSATGVNGDQDNQDTGRSGAAYVFTRSGGGWSQQAYLKASNTDRNDNFGISVAISGDTVVVGANREESTSPGVNGDQSNNDEDDVGAAYVFTRSGTTWSQQAYLKASNADRSDEFGWSVDIAGDTLVIGAKDEQSKATGVNGDQNNNDGFNVGAAYVFTRSGTTWSQQAYLKSNTDTFQNFGTSVAIFGNTVVVGAPSEGSNATGVNGDPSNTSLTGSGATYVFSRNGTSWSQQAYLKASNTDSLDHFGVSVAISDNTLIIGANDEESSATGVNGDQSNNATNNSGAAYVFTFPTESGGENNASFTIETAILELPVVVVGSVSLSARLRFEQQGSDAVVILESTAETMATSNSSVTFSPETGIATLPRVSLLNNGTVQSVVSAELVLIGGTNPLRFLVTNIIVQNP